MKYKGTYYEMWDAWFMNVNGTIGNLAGRKVS